jgi:hypothetical protein
VHVSLLLSPDERFTGSDTYVVFDQIPFELESGESAFRDEENSIAFEFPDQLEPGDYYMALWVDDIDDVAESNEDDNISPGDEIVEIVNTLPDLAIIDWYTEWNFFGDGLLVYNIINNGESTAPDGWLITLLLSENGRSAAARRSSCSAKERTSRSTPAIPLRDFDSPAEYSLFVDAFGNDVPTGNTSSLSGSIGRVGQ